MSKQFWAVVAVIVLIFVGIFAFGGNKSSKNSSKSSTTTLTNHVIGNGKSGVTLVEYGDYQCPYCQQYYPTVSAVQAKYNDQIFLQFRNFPLVNAHQNAFAAARAAEAAGMQGKYWQMHDILYNTSNWQVWTVASDPVPTFNQYAKALGLNAAQFKKDYASSKVNDLINADTAEGTKLNVQGTPTFFINGKKIDVTNSVDSFSKVIDAAISAKSNANN